MHLAWVFKCSSFVTVRCLIRRYFGTGGLRLKQSKLTSELVAVDIAPVAMKTSPAFEGYVRVRTNFFWER